MQPSLKKHPEVSAAEVIDGRLAVLDVRAPVEFEQGAVPQTTNLAILTNEERAAVGTLYREAGHDAAVQLGHELVSGTTRQDRIAAWLNHIAARQNIVVACWRGGQRSQIAQSWLAEEGVTVPRVNGGYKALRRACMSLLEDAAIERTWHVVAGRTGTGKTIVIRKLPAAIDLEAAANHRGSAFGARLEPQPAQATFENNLAYAYRHRPTDFGTGDPGVIVEDESRTIGRMGVPASWHQRMQRAPLVLVEASLDARVAHIKTEYVDDALCHRSADALAEHYAGALHRIRKRLGGVLHKSLADELARAFDTGTGHEAWIEMLLNQYYDPMYDYQLKQKSERIIFKGERDAVVEFLQQPPT